MNLGKTVLDILEQIAPTIGSLIGGPLVGTGISALEQAFGLAPGSGTADDLTRRIANMTPEDAIKLAQIDADLETKLAQAGIDLAKNDTADRSNARWRAVSMKDWTPTALGLVVIAGFIGVVFWVLDFGVSKGVDSMLAGALIGYIAGLAQQAGNYFFGSSAGSAQKNDLMDRWVNKLGGK